MGSLASRPKAPAIQQPVFIPVSVPATVSSPSRIPQASSATASDSTAATDSSPATPTDGEVAAQARTGGLLDRTRGRLSTVLTGFRGVLGQSSAAPQRKTLLGE